MFFHNEKAKRGRRVSPKLYNKPLGCIEGPQPFDCNPQGPEQLENAPVGHFQ